MPDIEKVASAGDFSTWLTPIAALSRLTHARDSERPWAILTRLKHGMVRAGAAAVSINGKPSGPCLISPDLWDNVDDYFGTGPFWRVGQFETTGSYTHGSRKYAFFDVRFDPAGIEAMIPNAPLARSIPPAPPPPAITIQSGSDLIAPYGYRTAGPDPSAAPMQKPHPGGRPPKEWWDELWASIVMQVYTGDLKPNRQGDIEKAMANWASANGHDAGEATFRRAAKALWALWSKEAQN